MTRKSSTVMFKVISVEERNRIEDAKKEKRLKRKSGQHGPPVASKNTKSKSTMSFAVGEEVGGNPVSNVYYLADGTARATNPMYGIHEFLQSQPIGQFVTMNDFKTDMKIDLTDERNVWLVECLLRNTEITTRFDDNGTLLFKRKHALDIHDDATLRHHLLYKLPEGHIVDESGLVMMGTLETELRNTYPSVYMDVDALIEDGDLVSVPGINGVSALLPAPPGIQASAMCRSLWDSIIVPSRNDLQNALIRSGRRTEADYEKRKQYHAKQRRVEQDERAAISKEAKNAARDEKIKKMMHKNLI